LICNVVGDEAPDLAILFVSVGAPPPDAGRSRAIIEDLLRRELGFDGVVVSDDMNMKAASLEDTGWQQAIVDDVGASVDMLLVCRDLDRAKRALEALRGAAERDPRFDIRLSDAAPRVARLRRPLDSPSGRTLSRPTGVGN
jgi:beta-N-acetylhexosaminidase